MAINVDSWRRFYNSSFDFFLPALLREWMKIQTKKKEEGEEEMGLEDQWRGERIGSGKVSGPQGVWGPPMKAL